MKGGKRERGRSRRESGMFCGLEVAKLAQKGEGQLRCLLLICFIFFFFIFLIMWAPELESLESSLVVVYITNFDRVSVIDDLYKNGALDRLEIWHTYSLSDLEKVILRNKCAEAWFYSRIFPKVEKSWIFSKIHKKYLEVKFFKSNYAVLFLGVLGKF